MRTTAEQIENFRKMIDADQKNLEKALRHGDRAEAHLAVDSIIDLQRAVEDLKKS